MAIQQNITYAAEWFTGEDKALQFSLLQADDVTPQDITGWALSWMVKRRTADADASALVTKTTSSGITLTSASSGICSVSVSDTDIASIVAGTLYHHELKRTDDGFETVLSYGLFVLRSAVHR
jgi:hypothetical protein